MNSYAARSEHYSGTVLFDHVVWIVMRNRYNTTKIRSLVNFFVAEYMVFSFANKCHVFPLLRVSGTSTVRNGRKAPEYKTINSLLFLSTDCGLSAYSHDFYLLRVP